MRSKGFDGMVCSIAGVMAAIGDRWGLLILRDLVCGLSRYEDFRKSSGVTNATLSDRLKHLEANGLIEQRRYQVNPERFEYHLTQKGRHIAPVMVVLAQIGDRLEVSGASAPPMKFVNRKTGADVVWTFIDQNTGEHVNAMDLAIQAGPGADDLVRWRLSHAKSRRHRVDHTVVSPGDTPRVHPAKLTMTPASRKARARRRQ
jgi:DNA-binding HxlR family transcriptional regulator